MSDRLNRTLNHLHWKHIAGAVLDVFYENKEHEKVRNRTASSDDWGIREDLRKSIQCRSAVYWSERTGEDKEEFPYNVDFVARLYFRFRKRNPEELEGFYKEINSEGLFST